MKKTKSTIGILLILAILVLGIGYAGYTTSIKVNGKLGATSDNANFKVLFTEAEEGQPSVASTTVTPSVTASEGDGNTATFSVTNFTAKGDTVTITYTVTNSSTDLTAYVTPTVKTTFDNYDYFSVTATFDGAENGTTKTIAAGGTADLKVVVTCKQTPTTDGVTEATTEGIVTLSATTDAPTSN